MKNELHSVINYNESYYPSLPKDGWIKRCYITKCRSITSSYIIITINTAAIMLVF